MKHADCSSAQDSASPGYSRLHVFGLDREIDKRSSQNRFSVGVWYYFYFECVTAGGKFILKVIRVYMLHFAIRKSYI